VACAVVCAAEDCQLVVWGSRVMIGFFMRCRVEGSVVAEGQCIGGFVGTGGGGCNNWPQ